MILSKVISRSSAIIAFSCILMTSAQAQPIEIENYIGGGILAQVAEGIQKGAEYAAAKALASEELARARRDFYTELNKGILESPSEQRFAQLLHSKDIYYLTLNATEGFYNSITRIRALDTIGGEALDGGVDPAANTAFAMWVDDVRFRLGAKQAGQLLFVFDPVKLKLAIEESKDSYDRYRRVRDQDEFKNWRASRPLIVAAKANTPEERADTYIRIVLGKAIDEALRKLPEDQRDATRAKIEPWVKELRQAIIDYEARPITPDVVARALKAWNYSDEDTAFFWSRVGSGRDLQGNAFITVVSSALAATQDYRDVKRYRKSFNAQPSNLEAFLKTWVSQQPNTSNAKGMDELYDHPPAPFARMRYVTVADLIASGHLGSEPPLPVFRKYGEVAKQP